jgi:hypothetical protein
MVKVAIWQTAAKLEGRLRGGSSRWVRRVSRSSSSIESEARWVAILVRGIDSVDKEGGITKSLGLSIVAWNRRNVISGNIYLRSPKYT